MSRDVTVLATGTRFDEFPRLASQELALAGSGLTPEQKGDRVRAAAGELVYVRSTSFVEFDAGPGLERWEDTPQGPHPCRW